MNQQGKRVTISTLAAAAGVSKQVVSAVLTGRAGSIRFSEKTRAAVLQAAADLGYRPNRTSRILAEQRHGVITVLFREFYVIPEFLMKFLVQGAERFDQILALEHLQPGRLPRSVAEDSVDGIIVFEELDETLRSAVEQNAIPIVHVNNTVRHQSNSVTFDEEGCVREILEHFAGRGRKHPLLVHSDLAHYWSSSRRQVFCSAHADFGLEAPAFWNADASDAGPGWEGLANFLQRNPLIDCAYLSVGDIGEALRMLRDIDRLATMSLVIRARTLYRLAGSDCACVKYNEEAMALAIVNLLNEQISGKSGSGPVRIPYTLTC